MKHFLLLILFSTLTAVSPAQAKTVPDFDSWVVYSIEETHSLWRFSENIGIKKKDISTFIKSILEDNPRLKNADLIHPGDNILIKSYILDQYVSRKKQFHTYRVHQKGADRSPSSIQQMQYKPEGSSTLNLQPSYSFSRIDANQRGTGAKASILSTFSLGLKVDYSWMNRWGPGTLSLDLNWADYNENLGRAIARNQVTTLNLEYLQSIMLSKTWLTFLNLGLYQSPYLFTNTANQLFLKTGTQPGIGLGIQKNSLSSDISLNFRVEYYYNGYAGDTIIDEGLGYALSAYKGIKLWDVSTLVSLFGRQRHLLSEVTSQQTTEIGMGLGFSF